MRLRLPLLALAMLSWGATATGEAAGRFSAPATGAVLEAGGTVSVAWELPSALVRDFSEMELVLSLDGGRTFPVRVTRDLDPSTRSFLFRVPALPAAGARLALRAGEEEEPDAEEIVLVSDEFVIEAASASPIEPTALVRGEHRVRDALDASVPIALDPKTFGSAAPTLDPDRGEPTASAPRPSPRADAGLASSNSTSEPASAVRTPLPRAPRLRLPADIPRRE